MRLSGRRVLVAFSLLLLSACSSVLTDRGYGVVKYGDSLQDAERALGKKAETAPGDGECYYVTFKDYPGVSFMIEDGKIVRADAENARLKNSLGIAIGAPLAEVLKSHPEATVEPHQYDPSGHYLLFLSPDRERAFVFEESGGRITAIRSGLAQAAQYVEGCL